LIAIRNAAGEEENIKIIVKGAAEYVLPMCTEIFNAQCRKVPLPK
jgi:hypothetical protein